MAYIKISDLESADNALASGTENFLTELQATEAQHIMGGVYLSLSTYNYVSASQQSAGSYNNYGQSHYTWLG
jgi:hypothetical protein